MKRGLRFTCLETSISPTTLAAYRRDLERFWAWAFASNRMRRRTYPIPPQLLLDYLEDHMKELKPEVVAKMRRLGHLITGRQLACTTLKRMFTSLIVEHMARNLPSPVSSPAVKLAAIRAWRGAALPKRVSKPITRDVLLKLLDTCEDNIRGERDRALLLVGFAGGGRRRSELAKLRVEDLHRVKGGYLGTLQNHKTFKITREPLIFPILGDAAKALDTWLKTGQISCGSIFRGLHRSGRVLGPINPKTVNRIIKDRCKKAGLSTENFGAHSLRSGFMTQAASDGIAFTDIMQISGHRSVEAAAKYLRPVAILKNRAAWLGNIPEPHAIAAMRNSAYKRRKGLEDNIVTLNASRRRR